MPASKFTPNYGFDLYVGSDKPNLLDQYNSAIGKIDTEIKTNDNKLIANETAVANMKSYVDNSISSMSDTVSTLGNNIEVVKSSVTANTAAISKVNSNFPVQISNGGTGGQSLLEAQQNLGIEQFSKFMTTTSVVTAQFSSNVWAGRIPLPQVMQNSNYHVIGSAIALEATDAVLMLGKRTERDITIYIWTPGTYSRQSYEVNLIIWED